MTDFGKRMMNGVVSERPPVRQIHRTHVLQIPDLTKAKVSETPIKHVRLQENVIDIPDFLYERKRKRLAEEYAQRQQAMYEAVNRRKPMNRFKRIMRKVLFLFFEEV